MSTFPRRLAAIAALLAFIVMIAMNIMANALPLNGVNTGALSDELPNLFVPAGVTFSIWGLIYLLLLGYLGVTLWEAFRGSETSPWTPGLAWVFATNAALNASWIVAWHWRWLPLSFLLILAILATLILHLELQWRRAASSPTPADGPRLRVGLRRRLLVIPIQVNLGWHGSLTLTIA